MVTRTRFSVTLYVCTLRVLFLSLLRPAELVNVEHRHRNASSQASPYCGRQICDLCPVMLVDIWHHPSRNWIRSCTVEMRAGAISTSWRLAFDAALLYSLYSKPEIIMVYGNPVCSLKGDELRTAGECDSFIF